VVARFFRQEFAGVLVTDFWAAYNAVVCRAATCLAHLLGGTWNTFAGHASRPAVAPFRQEIAAFVGGDAARAMRRHRHDLLTFLDHADVPFDNNAGERAIRPAVIIRKNSYCNRSQRGADTQAVLMSIYRTLKQRGLDPLATLTQALTDYLRTGIVPPLPP
jgi:hypothetical protein